jgi:AraC-like DNA-binding protein
MILGLFTRPYEVKFTTTVKVFSIRFKPEGIYNVFGVPASMFTDNYKDLSLVLGKEFRDFCRKLRGATDFSEMIRMTEIYLLKSLEQQQIDITYVNYAADLIRKSQGLKIEDISSQVSISQRQLEREFKAKIGIGPKKYLRLTRINEVLRLLEKNFELTLASVAYHCGYADQAHFIKDFKTITGVKPSVFIRERERFFSLTGLSHHDS